MTKRREWVKRKVVPHKTTIMLKGGTIAATVDEMFARIFWKSQFLSKEAMEFWRDVNHAEPDGLPVQAWREWGLTRGMSIGQFYNMIHGLVGAGMLERRKGRWHVSTGFLRELSQLTTLYAQESGHVSLIFPDNSLRIEELEKEVKRLKDELLAAN